MSGIAIPHSRTIFPFELRKFEIIRNGQTIAADIRRTKANEVHRWTIEQKIAFREGGWLAAAALGPRINALSIDARAHTGAIRVLVGNRPVRVSADVDHLTAALARQREYYAKEARYASDTDRRLALDLLDRAAKRLRDGDLP